jgi:hypothetical protein
MPKHRRKRNRRSDLLPSRSRTDEVRPTEHPDFERRPTNVRSRDKRICRLVLFGTILLRSTRSFRIP